MRYVYFINSQNVNKTNISEPNKKQKLPDVERMTQLWHVTFYCYVTFSKQKLLFFVHCLISVAFFPDKL